MMVIQGDTPSALKKIDQTARIDQHHSPHNVEAYIRIKQFSQLIESYKSVFSAIRKANDNHSQQYCGTLSPRTCIRRWEDTSEVPTSMSFPFRAEVRPDTSNRLVELVGTLLSNSALLGQPPWRQDDFPCRSSVGISRQPSIAVGMVVAKSGRFTQPSLPVQCVIPERALSDTTSLCDSPPK